MKKMKGQPLVMKTSRLPLDTYMQVVLYGLLITNPHTVRMEHYEQARD